MYICVRGHVYMCRGSCMYVLGVMYICVRGHVYVLGVMYICVRGIDFASVYMIFLLDFLTVLTV